MRRLVGGERRSFEHGKKFAAVRRGMQMILLHSHFVPVHPARCLAFERLLLLATMPQPEQVEVEPGSGRYAWWLSSCT